MFERIFLLGYSSTCFLPTGPYVGPLLFTGNLLRCFIVLRQAHDPTYYFGPLPLQISCSPTFLIFFIIYHKIYKIIYMYTYYIYIYIYITRTKLRYSTLGAVP